MIPSHPSQPVPSSATQSDRLTAVAACLTGHMSGGLIPLVIYFAKRNESPFVAYHGMLGFLSMATVLALSIVAWVLSLASVFLPFLSFLGCLLVGLPLVLFFGFLAFMVMGAIAAYNGEYARVPVVSDWAKRIVGAGP